MEIAILQSNYIPWKGYFDMINQVDEFIIYDDVQYTKSDWRNRNIIKTPTGPQWLTIPVYHNTSQKINETRIALKEWNKKHWKAIYQNYKKARCFDTFGPVLGEFYLSKQPELLSEININFIFVINSILRIETRIRNISEFNDLPQGKTRRLIEVCKQCNATSYLSGAAAKDYLDVGMLEREGIEVRWMDYSYPVYEQLYPPFTHNVSILDLIFNQGLDAIKYMT